VQATGTGTDNIMVVSGTTGPKVSYTGGHSKIGELIGKAVYEAVVYALEKQNGFKKLK
jgi:adenosylcobinamide amidohydrolase